VGNLSNSFRLNPLWWSFFSGPIGSGTGQGAWATYQNLKSFNIIMIIMENTGKYWKKWAFGAGD